MKTIEVANIDSSTGGGAIRAYKILLYRAKTRVECQSLLLGYNSQTLRESRERCPPIGFALPSKILTLLPLPQSMKSALLPLKLIFYFKRYGKIDADIVISHHETIESLRLSANLAETLGSKSLAILQLPPIYGNKSRLDNIMEAVQTFNYLLTTPKLDVRDIPWIMYMRSIYRPWNEAFYEVVDYYLKRFDMLLAVSPSIPLEMGENWSSRVLSLRPGYGFDENELSLLRDLKSRRVHSKPIVVFPARLEVRKGLSDLVLATRLIVRERRDFKLLVIGRGRDDIVRRFMSIVSRFNLKDNIIMMGYVPRYESFLLRREAKLILYPSHIDSYSYSVAESLLMGVPVIAYDIPALKLNFGGVDGLYLVRELDIEALAQKVLELLEARDISVGEPKVKLYDEVALEEKIILDKIAEKI
ncbi:MAG: glycosyltransferase family 4 protein [Acidilobaceae archaeon]